MICAFSRLPIQNKYECLRFTVSDKNEIIFDLHDFLNFIPSKLLLYIKWEYLKEAVESNFFTKQWPEANLKFDLKDIKKACLEKILNLVSFSKKSGMMIAGKNNIIAKLHKLNNKLSGKFALLQAYDASNGEKFGDKYSPIEYFDSLILSRICSKENIHYILVEGVFAEQIISIKEKVKYLD